MFAETADTMYHITDRQEQSHPCSDATDANLFECLYSDCYIGYVVLLQAVKRGPSDTTVEAACWQQWRQWSGLATISGHPAPTLRVGTLQSPALCTPGKNHG